uniref:MAM domain-containing protein n=1 Tax=Plectus sambesii TaxID=2011161 RepID=A0A914X0W6_9BILA
MRLALSGFFTVILTIDTVLACGNGNGGDPLISSGLRQAFGGTISSGIFPESRPNDGRVIQSAVDLNCPDFSNCRWRNTAAGDKLDWSKTSGLPESVQWQTAMGTKVAPAGDSAVLASTSRDAIDDGHLVSDPIGCMHSPIDLTVTAWRTSGRPSEEQRPVLRVCTRRVVAVALIDDNCQIVTAENGLPVTVVLYEPEGQGNIEIVISAYNYIASPASAVFIRDLVVEGEIGPAGCISSKTTTTKKPTTKPRQLAAATPCNKVPCSFEGGNTCSYTSAQNKELNAVRTFEPVSGQFRNPLTGIRQPTKGRYYLATYLYRQEKAVLEAEVELEAERVIRFKHYEATADIQLTACCDFSPVGADCPFATPLSADIVDREWKQSSFVCPKNTIKIFFICENTGVHQGACGMDDIEIYLNDRGNPDSSTSNACESPSAP